MPTQGKAAVFTAPGEVEVREVEVPDPGPGQALLRTEYSIISNGTEKWAWSGRFHSPGKDTSIKFPWIPGYQRVGIVEKLGEGVSALEEGQRVAATVSQWPGAYAGSWGSHTELGLTDAGQCLPVPESVDPVDAAGLVLTQVGYNGGTRPPVQPGWIAVVIGDGLVGQWAAQTFRARGCYVILCGRRPKRLHIAAQVSADEVVNDHEQSIEQIVAERFGAVDVVDEAVGLIDNVELAFRLLRNDGHLVFNGYHPEGEHLMNIQWMHDKEITCHGMAGWTMERLAGTLRLIEQGRLKVRELITHEFAGAEADKAYRMMWDKTDDFLGILLKW